MYFNVNFNVFFKLIKVLLLASELYISLDISIPLQTQFYKISVFKKKRFASFPATVLCKVRQAAEVFISNQSVSQSVSQDLHSKMLYAFNI